MRLNRILPLKRCIAFLNVFFNSSNQATNSWSRKADFGGDVRARGAGFSIGNKGYAGLGYQITSVSTTLKDDFWEYDPSIDVWTSKANYGGGGRCDVSTFTICDKGYIAQGEPGAENDLWEYDPLTNVWIAKANVGTTTREEGIGFSIGTKGYVGAGIDDTANYLRDFWEYTPDDCNVVNGIKKISESQTVRIFPNPFSSETKIFTTSFLTDATISIYNSCGIAVREIKNINGNAIVLKRENLLNGLYFIRIKQYGKSTLSDKLIIVD